ncbi:MAG: hypothetical protein DI566_05240 [Microbacterium sp.]|nr:MAG: hypothetical protein DI566_05240 [Microbacterium sp.]
MDSFILIAVAGLLGLLAYRFKLHLADTFDPRRDVSPRHRWRFDRDAFRDELEVRAASDLGATLVGAVLALAAATASQTLGQAGSPLGPWWWLAFIPGAILLVVGTVDSAKLVYPMTRSRRSWTIVLLYYASGIVYLVDAAIGLQLDT